jgi:acetolactate synthase-1/3 small subunit
MPEPKKILIKLRVNNHPGVMSQITGLFSRRAYNLEGILCAPVGEGAESLMLLLVAEGGRIAQVLSQLRKLYDVLELSVRRDFDSALFRRFLEESGEGEGSSRESIIFQEGGIPREGTPFASR